MIEGRELIQVYSRDSKLVRSSTRCGAGGAKSDIFTRGAAWNPEASKRVRQEAAAELEFRDTASLLAQIQVSRGHASEGVWYPKHRVLGGLAKSRC